MMNPILILLWVCFGIVILDDGLYLALQIEVLRNFSLLTFVVDTILYVVSFGLWILYTLQRLVYLDIENPLRLLYRIVLSFVLNVVGSFAFLVIDLISTPFQWLSQAFQQMGWDNPYVGELGQLVTFDYLTLTLRVGLSAEVFDVVGLKVGVQFSILGSPSYSSYGYSFDSIGFLGFDVNFIRTVLGSSDEFIQVSTSLEQIVIDSFKAMADNNGGSFQIVNELLEATGLDRLVAEAIAGLGVQIKPMIEVSSK